MKIHLACGRHILDGWTNCDLEKHPGAKRDPDIFCDVSKVPLDDGIADELLSVHILEHFYQWEVAGVLAEWHRLLKVGGKLVIEMPDIRKAALNLLDGGNDQMAMWPIYGDQTLKNPLMCHKWGWTYKTLLPVLINAGFEGIVERPTEWHGRKQNRDFRVEAFKC
jgi:predicted SAM-dependent methyltransferase